MIHPTAVIDPAARLGVGVSVGPYAIIDGPVQVGDGCVVGPHAHLLGHTTVGARTRIHTGAVVGDEPQDYHFKGERSYTDIGADCLIREYVTIHRGAQPESRTVVGNHCMLMGGVHVAHNCLLADDVILANMALLAGHVEIGARAFLSGGVMVHQFVRIGQVAMISAGSRLGLDVAPFCTVGRGDRIYGVNLIGLRRAQISGATRKAIRSAVKVLFFSDLTPSQACLQLEASAAAVPEVQQLVDFVRASKRGLTTARPRGITAAEARELGVDGADE